MENEEPDLAGAFGASAPVIEEVVEAPQIEPQPVVPQETPDQVEARNGGNRIPLAEYLSEREKRQIAERQLAEMRKSQSKPEAKPIDEAEYFATPHEAVRRTAMEVAQQTADPIVQSLMFNSRLVAHQIHGAELAGAAEKAFNDALANGEMDQSTYQRVNGSPNPYHAAVEWYRQQQVLKTVGNDLSAYEQKLLDDKLKDPEFLAKAVAAHQAAAQARQPNGQFGAKPTNVSRLPPSLNRATGAASSPAGDVSDEDMARAFGAT